MVVGFRGLQNSLFFFEKRVGKLRKISLVHEDKCQLAATASFEIGTNFKRSVTLDPDNTDHVQVLFCCSWYKTHHIFLSFCVSFSPLLGDLQQHPNATPPPPPLLHPPPASHSLCFSEQLGLHSQLHNVGAASAVRKLSKTLAHKHVNFQFSVLSGFLISILVLKKNKKNESRCVKASEFRGN